MKIQFHILVLFVCLSNCRANEDRALRAFLNLRSSTVELAHVDKSLWYVFTVAKFESGKFVGFGHFHTGQRTPQEKNPKLEVIWGKKDGAMGYASTSLSSSFEFEPDVFFEGVTLSSSGNQRMNSEIYEGFFIQGFAAVRPTDESPLGGVITGDFAKEAQRFPKLIVLLYRDFEKRSDYMDFLKQSKMKANK